jgi:short-subunit dehydrogenase
MKELVMITGASSGMGYEMSKLLAKRGYDLVLTARRRKTLEQLADQLQRENNVSVHIFSYDLAETANAQKLYDDVKKQGLKLTMLVNNAGFGDYGEFTQIPLDKQVDMINVNITSIVILSRLFLDDMKKQGYGKLMNIASLLSYIPFPYYAVYSATKSFVLAFTETLAAEMEGSGVEVKALCPGPTNTGFNTDAMLNTNAYQSNKPIPATEAARVGVDHLLNGKGSKKIGFNTWFISNLPRVTPDRIMMKIKKNLASQRKS